MADIVRWIARVVGTLFAGVFLLFLWGEGAAHPTLPIFLRLAASAGILIAWRYEAWGGCLAFGSMIAATLLSPWVLPMTLGLSVPGLLFLLSWFLRRRNHPKVLPFDA
jgi:hypothetical protein